MNRLMLLIVIIGVCLAGCCSFEDLEPGNKLAMENQANLEKNVVRQLENFEKLAEASHWDASDKAIFAEQKKAIIEQLTINYAWLLVLKDAIENDDATAELLGTVIKELPGWIEAGKDIADLIKKKGD